jgi:hypothetical protein
LPSTSFTSPTVATNDNSYGTTPWTINSVNDCVCIVDKTTSNYLKFSNYGFSIPISTSISGIEVSITCSSSGPNIVPTIYAQLLKSAGLVGSSKSLSPMANTVFGGSTDLWDATFSEAEVESSDFGVTIWVSGGSNGRTAYVTGATIKVHYLTGGGGGSGSPSSSTSGHFIFHPF